MQMSIAEITLDVDMGGEKTRYGTGSSRTFKASGRNFIGKVLSILERNQSYLLTATDEFYKGAARGTEKATQSLIDQGKIKTTDKEYAAKQADQLAKYRTFQDDTKISVAIQQIHDILNLAGVGDSGKTIKGQTVHAFGAGDIVAPFTRVAGNLVSPRLEYSPVNAVKGLLEIVQQVAKTAGGQNVDPAAQAKGVSDLARGMTGTAIAYGFMLLARSGLLRQAEDEADEDVAGAQSERGHDRHTAESDSHPACAQRRQCGVEGRGHSGGPQLHRTVEPPDESWHRNGEIPGESHCVLFQVHAGFVR